MNDREREPSGEVRLDLESLAAYLDGSLAPEERARVERLLATSEEARDVLAEAIRLQPEATGDDADEGELPDVVPSPAATGDAPTSTGGRASRRPRWLVPTLAAAAVIALVMVPTLRRAPSAGSPDGLVAAGRLLQGAPDLLTRGWDRHGWTVTRSAGVEIPEEEAAFRVGVRWTDALVAWQGGSGPEASAHFAQIAALLDNVPLSEPASRSVAELRTKASGGSAPADASTLITDSRTRLGALLPSPWLDLGTRVEALRLAARGGSVSYLRDAGAKDVFTDEDLASVPSGAAADLRQVREILRGDLTPDELGRAAEILDRVVAQLGG